MLKTTLPRFKKALPASSTRSDLEGLVKDSSDKVRQFFFAYLALIAYVLAVVFATTDKQLLLVNEGLKLPIVDLTVPLIGFYVVIPLFVLGLHFNLLQNLASHHFKLMELQRAWKGTVPSERINASMFDNAMLEKNSIFMHWVQTANSLLCLYSGAFVLSAVLWRFADYQNGWILLEHGLLLWLDLYFIAQTKKSFIDNKYSFNKNSVIKNKRQSAQEFFASILIMPFNTGQSFKWFAFWLILICIILLKILICIDIFILDWRSSFLKNLPQLKKQPEATFASSEDYKIAKVMDWFIPRIVIESSNLLFTPDTKNLEANAALLNEKDWRKYFDDNSQSLDFRNRSLRYLDISRQVLPRLMAQDAQLQGANLASAKLQNSNFRNANLQGATLWLAQLQNAQFDGAQMQSTNLLYAQMQGANLSFAKLQAAELWFTQLQGADLFNADLHGANLISAELQGAKLKEANLQGTLIIGANFQGANMHSVQMQGADLIGNKIGSFRLLSNGIKANANNFDLTNLTGTYFHNVEIWGINFLTINVSILTDSNNPTSQNFFSNKPTQIEIQQWAENILDSNARNTFLKRMKDGEENNSNKIKFFKADDMKSISELIQLFCNPVTKSTSASLKGLLGYEGAMWEHNSRVSFIKGLKNKPECTFHKTTIEESEKYRLLFFR